MMVSRQHIIQIFMEISCGYAVWLIFLASHDFLLFGKVIFIV